MSCCAVPATSTSATELCCISIMECYVPLGQADSHVFLPVVNQCLALLQASSMLTPRQLQHLQSAGGETGGLSWFKWRDTNPEGRPSVALEYDDFDQTYAAIKQGEGGCIWLVTQQLRKGCNAWWSQQLRRDAVMHGGPVARRPNHEPSSK